MSKVITSRSRSIVRCQNGRVRTNSLISGIGTAVLAGLAIERRRRELQAVASELRHGGLWVPTPITNAVELAVTRRIRARQEHNAPAVPCARLRADTGAAPPVDLLRFDPPEPTQPGGEAAPTGAVLWIHGGGLLVGSPERTAPFAAELAADLGVPVFCNRYRLAPEHPYPAAIDDCFTALQWLHVQADELGIDRQRIVIGGHSAGGGLAAVLAQRAHDAELPVAQQTLVYPMLDERTGFGDQVGQRGRIGWDAASNRYGWSSYLGHQPIVADRPWAAARRRKDLSGLPPTWIGVGDLDLFHDEDLEYAQRLRRAGVPTELVVVPGMYHAAERDVPDAPSMIDFTSRMRANMRRALSGSATGGQ